RRVGARVRSRSWLPPPTGRGCSGGGGSHGRRRRGKDGRTRRAMREAIGEGLGRGGTQGGERAEGGERGEGGPTPGHQGRQPASDPSQVYTVRIPVSRLRELRAIAAELGEPPATLIRRWVLERLDAAGPEAPGKASTWSNGQLA